MGLGAPTVIATVIAGDTVRDAAGTAVRLAGIEVPRAPLDLRADAPWPLAAAARVALANLVGGRSVELIPAGEGTPDRHGRLPAYLRLADGTLAQEALLAEGLARARWLPGEGDCFVAFRDAEIPARAARKGLWASPHYATRLPDDPSLGTRNGLYELVEGRVISVGHGFRMVFLDFGRNFRRDFTVMVPPAVADAMLAAGLPADSLLDRRIRVRGVIEESGGPAIRLNDPAEIEVLD